MGDRLTEEQQPTQTAHKTYGEIFDEQFPYYLAIGMTPEEYWDGESWLKPAYRKAYEIRMKREQTTADMQNWYMGQYIIKALQAVPLLVAGLNVKRGTDLPDYPDKPFLIQAEEEKKEELRRKHEEDQQQLAMAIFQQFTMKMNKNIEKRLEKERMASATGQ